MTTRKQSLHPNWGRCGGYHESFEEELSMTPEDEDFSALADEALRELVARDDEVPSHELSRDELLCLLNRRRRAKESVPGKAILL